MQLLYNFSIEIYLLAIKVASLFSGKAKKWLEGRAQQIHQINQYALIQKKRKRVWFHCASLGEFEQARPLIDSFKTKHDCEIILTFFSPSGFEVRKNYEHANQVFYLPLDQRKKVRWFLDAIQADEAIFVKYEFWFNYLEELGKRKTQTYLVSGIFRRDQHFFSFYGSWFRSKLKNFDHFFLQDQNSANLLSSLGLENHLISGDTRFDQVLKIKKTPFSDQTIDAFIGKSRVVVFGSSWQREDELAKRLLEFKEDIKVILAPHEVNTTKREKLLDFYGGSAKLYSTFDAKDSDECRLLILDTFGLLSKIYRYSTIAVIGGGFGKGIHNSLEAAIYSIPVVFGPNYKKFNEAKQMLEAGCAFTFESDAQFFAIVNQLLDDEMHYKNAANCAGEYCNSHLNATQKIMDHFEKDNHLA